MQHIQISPTELHIFNTEPILGYSDEGLRAARTFWKTVFDDKTTRTLRVTIRPTLIPTLSKHGSTDSMVIMETFWEMLLKQDDLCIEHLTIELDTHAWISHDRHPPILKPLDPVGLVIRNNLVSSQLASAYQCDGAIIRYMSRRGVVEFQSILSLEIPDGLVGNAESVEPAYDELETYYWDTIVNATIDKVWQAEASYNALRFMMPNAILPAQIPENVDAAVEKNYKNDRAISQRLRSLSSESGEMPYIDESFD